ncbi:MAG: trypsin-like serine protease [Nevskia sp.]|nr:trypsin-like serine protease [Nevskia sp.]
MALLRRVVFLLLPLLALPAAALQPDLNSLAAVPRIAVDGAAAARAVTAAQQRQSRPVQFAAPVDLPLRLSDGRWDTLAGGVSSWRLRVASAGARSLSFAFSRFHVPDGGEVWIYDPQGGTMQGPYTALNNTADGRLWTAIVPGGEAVIEARVPTASRDQLQLELAQVQHGFLDFATAAAGNPQPRTIPGGTPASSCEVNVACPAGAAWSNEARAVAVYTVGNKFICTGQLVNDVPGDNAPYFLTANHCEIGQTLTTPALSVVMYWNYQASSCSGTSAPITHTQTGATLVAGDTGSDFTLIKLLQQPNSAYNVWYAGWDVTGQPSGSGVDIHQPGGDLKKISVYDTQTSKVTVNLQGTSRTVQAWDVIWSQGITEDGSSGSGLYNSNHYLIGVLSGGNSSCANPGGDDVFGRLDVAWTAQSQANGQLKATLDPQGTGAQCLAGRNPGDSPTPGGCTNGGGSGGLGSGGGGGGAWSPLLAALLLPLALLRRRRAWKQ